MAWLQKPQHWNIGSLRAYLQRRYGVEYQSKQSSYDLLHEAKLSWKKSQKRTPKADPEQVTATRDTIKKKNGSGGLADSHQRDRGALSGMANTP